MSEKERKLTTAEMKRKEIYEKLCKKMEQDGYKKQELTVDIVTANIAAVIIMLPFAVAIALIYIMVNPIKINVKVLEAIASFSNLALFLVIFFICIVLHELIHGLIWGILAKDHFHAIAFGVIWEALTPYCTCSEPLKKWQYILGAAMPTLVLGFALAAIAITLEQPLLFVLSEIMVFSGGGDFFIILKMLLYRQKNKRVMYYDHPYECGVVAFEKNN